MTRSTPFRRSAIGLAAFAAICLALFVYAYVLAGGRGPLRDPYEVQAVLPTAVNLATNGDVREAGVKVGRIVELSNRGPTAVALLEIDDEHAPIYRDATVLVRAKTLIGENYLELNPGRPAAGALESGERLPIDQALEATQIDEILSALDARTRRHLQRTLDGLGRGFDRRGDDLSRLFEAVPATVDEGGPVAHVLSRQRAEVARVVDNFGRVMRALGDREQSVRTLARQARRAAASVARRDDALGDTIDELPATLRQARTTTDRLGAFSAEATPVVRNLRLGFDALAPVTRDLRPAAAAARRTMAELERFSAESEPTLVELRRFSESGARFLRPLDLFLRDLVPLADFLAPRSRELGAFFANLRSFTNSRDALGNMARVHVIQAPSAFSGFTGEMERAYQALIQAGALSRSLSRGNNAYPPPGGIGDPKPFSGSYPRLERLGPPGQ